MKKFLFTLAALLMTSTAFAESYLYIDAEDVVVTADDIANGTELEIPVRASFAARVSGWDFEITNLPAGITFTFAEKGADFDVTTKNARGRDQVVSATLYGAEEPYLHMLAVQGEVGYWQDPNGENPNAWVSYGVAKWEGGEYAEMLLMYAIFDENYHGGVIETLTSVASGNDARGGTVQEQGDHAKYFTHDGGMMEDPNPITEEPADAPVIEFAEDGSGVMITIENYTECSIKVDGVEVATEAPYYVEKIYDAAQEIEVYAKNAPEGFTPAEDTKTYTLPEKQKEQTSKPSVTYSYENGELTVWAYGSTEDGVVYTLYCDGVEYTGEMPIAYDIYEGYNHVWTATALAPNCLVSEMSDECPIVIDAVVPEYQTPDPVITVTDDSEAQVVTITVTGEGTVTIVVTKMNDDPMMTGEVVYEASGESPLTYEIPYGEVEAYYSVYATATADMPGYDVIPGDATEPFVVVPAKPAAPEVTATPTVTIDGYTVTATGDGTVYLYVDDEVVATGEGTATYTINPDDYPEGAELGVTARAQEPGKEMSEWAPAQVVYVDAMLTGALNFSEVNQENGQFSVSYNGDEDVTITLNDETITLVRGTSNTYQLPDYGTYEVTATATAAGYRPITKDATLVWTKAEEAPAAPQITIDTTDGAIIVGASDVEGATVVLYQCDDAEGTNPRVIDNPTSFLREDANYTVWVYAVATNNVGETSSTVTEVVIPAKPTPDPETAINEMTAGKAIANVRYFNMAGQEMQEANGMTIVVTTYTDGTSSAVKVMK